MQEKGRQLQNKVEIAIRRKAEKGSSLKGTLREGREDEVEAAPLPTSLTSLPRLTPPFWLEVDFMKI